MQLSKNDLKKYMERCIELAKYAPIYIVKPRVGALVLSKDCNVIGEGYRSFLTNTSFIYHAERMALDHAKGETGGGTLITTLEPCVKIRKDQIFKSCCDLMIENRIETVVIGISYNSLHVNSGRGIDYLKRNKINVVMYGGLAEIIKKELMPPTYANISF